MMGVPVYHPPKLQVQMQGAKWGITMPALLMEACNFPREWGCFWLQVTET